MMQPPIRKAILMLFVSRLLKERRESHATPSKEDHPDVVCISIIEGEERISCNAQQRKSIDDYKLRCSAFGEPLLAMNRSTGR
jgi:hypothetical protein